MRKTAQNSASGEIIEREHEGQTYRFRVRKGGYQDSTDNKLVYTGDPTENPLPAELYFQIEENEAWIMVESESGSVTFYDPDDY